MDFIPLDENEYEAKFGVDVYVQEEDGEYHIYPLIEMGRDDYIMSFRYAEIKQMKTITHIHMTPLKDKDSFDYQNGNFIFYKK